METTQVGRPGTTVELPGSGSAGATLEVVYQPRATRVARALIVLAVTVVVMPVVFFLPPHLLWPLVALGTGVYLARKYWVGEYHVRHFEAACPRCGTALELKTGQRVRNGHVLECYGCHRQPRLVIDEPDD